MSHRHDFHDHASRTPAPLRPCDLFSEEIHLLVDRELGEAEREIVEDHLLECPRCLGLANHLERMSSVLKAWDQEANDLPVPDLRLRQGVLARVAESGARRRRDDRFVRLLHAATAAVVVLGLGLAVVLGLQAGDGPRATDPASVVAVQDAPWPLEARTAHGAASPSGSSPSETAPFETAPFEERLTAEDLLAGIETPVHPDLQDDPGLVSDAHMKVFGSGDDASLAALDARLARLEHFVDRFGMRAMYWNGPYAIGSAPRVVPERTYRWLEAQGLLATWRDRGVAPSRTVVGGARPSTPPMTSARATGVAAEDMLRPMPGITSPLRLRKQRPMLIVPAIDPKNGAVTAKAGGALLELRAIDDAVGRIPGLRSGPLNMPNRAFLDPIAAAANGQLRFVESQDHAGRIVAFVEGTKRPIFIPAGQLLTGGYGDRVIRHPLWLPASARATPHLVECFVVQGMPNPEAKGTPRLLPHVAGPTLRALLASGAGQAEVKAAAARICKAHRERYGRTFRDWNWSLREFYSATSGTNAAVQGLSWKGKHGFLATDAQGRLLGFELLRIEGPAAEALLGRLWIGYVTEAVWRAQSTALREAFAAPSDGAERVLGLLAEHPGSFRIPTGVTDTEGARVSTLELEASGVQLHALEVGQRPAFVSGLSGGR